MQLHARDLRTLYIVQKKSVRDIATQYYCSEHKVNYWLGKHGISKRSISEAIYLKANPNGDPFAFREPRTKEEMILFGLGLGLYWGEGTKKNKNAVRLANSDAHLIRIFMHFLMRCYGVSKDKFRFWLQVFDDMSPEDKVRFWQKELGVSKSQFGKVTITPTRGPGTYREKTKNGVLAVYVSNTKLRNALMAELDKLREKSMLNKLSQKPT